MEDSQSLIAQLSAVIGDGLPQLLAIGLQVCSAFATSHSIGKSLGCTGPQTKVVTDVFSG